MNFREPIRVGMVGLGRAGLGMHAAELAALPGLFRVVAVCDPVKERRDLAIERVGLCRAYRRYEDLLADGDVELVDIVTRSDDHLAHALAGLKLRKWVTVETPMCLNYEEALILRAAAIKAGNRLFVRHNRRFDPGFQQLCEIVRSGRLGEVYDIKLRHGAYRRRDDWQSVSRCGGGQLLNGGPHAIDQALQLLGASPARLFSDLKRVAALGDAEDYVRIVMRSADGLTVDLEVSDGGIMAQPEYQATGKQGAASVTGNELVLRYLDPAKKLPRRRASVRTPTLRPDGAADEKLPWVEERLAVAPKAPCGSLTIWEHLAAAIRLNRKYPVTLEDAVEVMRIVSLVRKETTFT
jgi:predicted dehydrogenase